MTTRNTHAAAVLLLVPLLFLFLITSCDSDNNMLIPDSEAQEPMPELGEEDAFEGCPCFNENDIVGIGDASSSVECGTTVFGIALIPDNAPPVSLECMEDGSMCMCSFGSDTMMINQDQYKSCFTDILNGMIMYNEMSLKTVGCE